MSTLFYGDTLFYTVKEISTHDTYVVEFIKLKSFEGTSEIKNVFLKIKTNNPSTDDIGKTYRGLVYMLHMGGVSLVSSYDEDSILSKNMPLIYEYESTRNAKIIMDTLVSLRRGIDYTINDYTKDLYEQEILFLENVLEMV